MKHTTSGHDAKYAPNVALVMNWSNSTWGIRPSWHRAQHVSPDFRKEHVTVALRSCVIIVSNSPASGEPNIPSVTSTIPVKQCYNNYASDEPNIYFVHTTTTTTILSIKTQYLWNKDLLLKLCIRSASYTISHNTIPVKQCHQAQIYI